MRASGGGEDLGWDQPDSCEPADSERAGGDEENDGADDARDDDWDVKFGGVLGKAAEDGEQGEAGGEHDGALDEELAAPKDVDENPGEGHEEEVGGVVAESEVL